HRRRTDDEIDVRIEELAHLVAGDLSAAPAQLEGLIVGFGFRAGDDGAAVEEHARQAAHPRSTDADKMDSLAGELTCRARFRSQLAHDRLHNWRHDTASGRQVKALEDRGSR